MAGSSLAPALLDFVQHNLAVRVFDILKDTSTRSAPNTHTDVQTTHAIAASIPRSSVTQPIAQRSNFGVLDRKDTASILTVKLLERELNVQQLRRGAVATRDVVQPLDSSVATAASGNAHGNYVSRKSAADYAQELEDLVGNDSIVHENLLTLFVYSYLSRFICRLAVVVNNHDGY